MENEKSKENLLSTILTEANESSICARCTSIYPFICSFIHSSDRSSISGGIESFDITNHMNFCMEFYEHFERRLEIRSTINTQII